MTKRRYIILDHVWGEYSGTVYQELNKRHNKDGTINLKVKEVSRIEVKSSAGG